MNIVTWTNTRAPDGFKVIGKIFVDGEMQIVVFHGNDVDSVRRRAQEWWDAGGDLNRVGRKRKAKASAD